jgi:hypothetical protein
MDLCPFARGPLEAGRVRFARCEDADPEQILTDLWMEVERLVGTSERELETTLLVIPEGMADFEDFLDLLQLGDEIVLERTATRGHLQLVGFHPLFRFDGAEPDDPANFVNRCALPVIHLLRASSIDRVVEAGADVQGIPTRNASLLRALPPEHLSRLCLGRGARALDD